ncbi:MAG: Gfo/Idh/MocA family oxidoreductase, partial [Candidatus Dormibacteraeota bacterium]|nr:Gfo/Idh/MocA family oxidoreductase [Candidatus Dormibacteraeota bacterium]
MPESKLRIGVIGFDHWYSALPMVRTLASHPAAELAGIADPDPERAHQAGVRAGRPDLVLEAPEALIEDPSVEVIASFIDPGRNPEICIAAARQGKHLLSIKPVARTLEEADRVVAAVEEAGVSFLPAESRGRLAAINQQLRSWIDEGRFGQMLSAYCSLWATLPQRWPGDHDPGWFADPERTVGGGWIDHAIYQIDLLRWLSGQEVVSA